MPQELHVLRCYSCQTFQVHIVKKSNKWECKMCGEKQSIKKVYGRGGGRDCRLHVQRLNEMRMKEEGFGNHNIPCQEEGSEDAAPVSCVLQDTARYNADKYFLTSHCSKWSKFLDGHRQDPEETDDAVTCSSVALQSQITSKAHTNVNMTAAEEESKIKKQILQSHFFNSPKQEAALYDGSSNILCKDVTSEFLYKSKDACQNIWHEGVGLKGTENCFSFDDENGQDGEWNREYVGNKQDNGIDSLDGSNALMQQPADSCCVLQHGRLQCRNDRICVKSQQPFLPELALLDNEDELDNILRF